MKSELRVSRRFSLSFLSSLNERIGINSCLDQGLDEIIWQDVNFEAMAKYFQFLWFCPTEVEFMNRVT